VRSTAATEKALPEAARVIDGMGAENAVTTDILRGGWVERSVEGNYKSCDLAGNRQARFNKRGT
jgi:hypothetical protein